MTHYNFDHLRNLSIGTVNFVSPGEIKVVLDSQAPQNTALNTGSPTAFPRINGFVLIPNEVGALVGLISWIGVENSPYPKRNGYKDFDLIDLPFPLRKMSITPMGTLKQDGKIEDKSYKLERGVYSYPSIGDSVILPTDIQLKSIVETGDKNSLVKIGIAPIAANADVRINPDKLFGRHLAILGNTGSGKSCSVAGVIRWSLEQAQENLLPGKELNARFVILDPNGEYTHSFDDLEIKIKRFKLQLTQDEIKLFNALKVPGWLWNSSEWSAFSSASSKTQAPILKRALSELRSGSQNSNNSFQIKVRAYLSSCYASLSSEVISVIELKNNKTPFGHKLKSIAEDILELRSQNTEENLVNYFTITAQTIKDIASSRYKTFLKEGEVIEFYDAFTITDVEKCIIAINSLLSKFGGIIKSLEINEDSPVRFPVDLLADLIEKLSHDSRVSQFVDYLVVRLRSMLSDNRLNDLIVQDENLMFDDWLNDYLKGLVIIDLSLIPSNLTHLIVAIVSRIIFEALQRYRKMHNKLLPTTIVMEEAHYFIKRYTESQDEISASQLCTSSFEKIAREGRKFGLSLVLSSQRPSELSATVLSQCNTFLLHRLVNDLDQDLVRKLVPDNLGALLKELPVLPTRKAILLGWAAPLPILVEMNELKPEHRPKSEDPDFWDVWTGNSERAVDWKLIADEWQGVSLSNDAISGTENEVSDESDIENNLGPQSSTNPLDDIPF